MMRARLLVAGLLLAFAPRVASAQFPAFLQATRALAAAAIQPEPARSIGIREAVPRLQTTLAEWDRAIRAEESRVDRELHDATPPRAYRLHLELGVVYRTRGRLTDALREFDAATTLQPSSPDLQMLRALTLDAAGRTEESGRAFHNAWSADPGNPVKAYYALQRNVLSTTADRDRAVASMARAYGNLLTVTAKPAYPPFLTLDAVADTLSPTPVIGDAATAQAFALFAAGKYREAVSALARPARPDAAVPDDDPLDHFTRAQHDEADNRVSDARHEYAASLAGALAGRSVIYVAIGRLALVEGDSAGAVDAFTQAVRLNPNDPLMHQELAAAYAAVGAPDASLIELIAGLLIDPSSSPLFAAIGQLHLDADRPADALPALTRALELDPERYEVRYALATALTRLGRIDEATRQLDEFERVRREMLERRRQGIQEDVQREESIRRGLTTPGQASP